jgi:hypothetical protein
LTFYFHFFFDFLFSLFISLFIFLIQNPIFFNLIILSSDMWFRTTAAAEAAGPPSAPPAAAAAHAQECAHLVAGARQWSAQRGADDAHRAASVAGNQSHEPPSSLQIIGSHTFV